MKKKRIVSVRCIINLFTGWYFVMKKIYEMEIRGENEQNYVINVNN